MKYSLAGVVMVLLAFGCAGCGPQKPPEVMVRKELERALPAPWRLEAATFRFSPFREIMGTSLPEGTWQIQTEAEIAPAEPLYVLVTPETLPTNPYLPESVRNELVELQQLLKEFPGYSLWNQHTNASLPLPKPFLVEVKPTGKSVKTSALLAATPLSKGWQIDTLEAPDLGQWAGLKPASAFNERFAVRGSAAQRTDYTRCVDELQQLRRRASALNEIQPAIDALEASRPELRRQRHKEAYAAVSAIEQRRLKELSLHNREVTRIYGLGTMRNDFRERVEPLQKEQQRHREAMALIDAAAGDAQTLVEATAAAADAEIDRKIVALKASVGIAD